MWSDVGIWVKVELKNEQAKQGWKERWVIVSAAGKQMKKNPSDLLI